MNCLLCSADAIYVRVYEARMDLLRAVIIGANGTPYHDGLFCFDIQFPSSYPKVPPVWNCFFKFISELRSVFSFLFGSMELMM